MILEEVIKSLDRSERILYEAQTASEYFRLIYYSKDFIKIQDKLDKNEKLSEIDWSYLIKRLFLVTVKAISEEDSVNFMNKFTYSINKIGTKVLKKGGSTYNECAKMIAFIDFVRMEKEINKDLLIGLDIVEKDKQESELDILLNQHREASIFRDNQDSFCDSYTKAVTGEMTDSEMVLMNAIDRSYLREKALVKEYTL